MGTREPSQFRFSTKGGRGWGSLGLADLGSPLGGGGESGAEALWTMLMAVFCTRMMRVRSESPAMKKIREKQWKGRFRRLHHRNRGGGENFNRE
jgi:hypothetical protein